MYDEASVRRTTPDAPTSRGRTILVVEDDEDLRFLCSEVLRARGFIVIECGTLTAAYDVLEHRVPDLLLLDRELPDGSGLDLARWLRRRASFDRVKVVGFSGRKAAHEIAESLAAGCDVFVPKPCAPAALVEGITALLAAPPTQRRTRAATRGGRVRSEPTRRAANDDAG